MKKHLLIFLVLCLFSEISFADYGVSLWMGPRYATEASVKGSGDDHVPYQQFRDFALFIPSGLRVGFHRPWGTIMGQYLAYRTSSGQDQLTVERARSELRLGYQKQAGTDWNMDPAIGVFSGFIREQVSSNFLGQNSSAESKLEPLVSLTGSLIGTLYKSLKIELEASVTTSETMTVPGLQWGYGLYVGWLF